MRLSQQESVAVRNIAAMPRAHLDTVYPGRKNGSEYCGLVAARLSRTERLNVQNRRWHPRGGDRGCARSSRASVPSLLRSTVQCSELSYHHFLVVSLLIYLSSSSKHILSRAYQHLSWKTLKWTPPKYPRFPRKAAQSHSSLSVQQSRLVSSCV